MSNTPNSIDLNITNRNVPGTEWSADQGKLTFGDLEKIGEQRTDNGGALNALPTPFARFFVIDEAFRRLREQKRNPENKAGIAYEQLVSNCLDIYELLFRMKYHKCDIQIREWHLKEHLPILKEKVPTLGRSIENYFDDLGENTDRIYFVVLVNNGKEYLLGSSSPMTGFVTPPDLDRSLEKDKTFVGEECYGHMPLISRKGENSGKYFKDIVLFENREEDFRNYMCNKVFGQPHAASFKNIFDYIKAFADAPDIKNTYMGKVNPIRTTENNQLVINGVEIFLSDSIADKNYFMDTIIQVPYRISEENFVVPHYDEDKDEKREHDYLLPLTAEALTVLDVSKLECTYKEGSDAVTVTLKYEDQEFKKRYVSRSPRNTDGKIEILKDEKINFDLGLFPNVKSDIDAENPYYKLMVAFCDNNSRKTFKEIVCSFYYNNKPLEEGDDTYKSGVKPMTIRSEQTENGCTTVFYELFHTSFDAIRLQLIVNGERYQGILLPKWKSVSSGNDIYTYAIDLGTSNTFISKRKHGKGEDREMQEPEQLTTLEPFMSYLHAKTGSTQQREVDRWEDEKLLPKEIINAFRTEFVPPMLDGIRYKFPIRTALCKTKSDTNKPILFDNSNIAFRYEKQKFGNKYEVCTNLKWTKAYTDEVRVFIRELLLIIKNDILQNGGKLAETEIIWFRPLSFSNGMHRAFEKIWKEETLLIIGSDKLTCYTESEAPYYYFSKRNDIKSLDSVTVVDIGGGSTDIVYFESNKPKLANSVHFGCDVLWSNGYNDMVNSDENGIYQAYKDQIRFKSRELNELNEEMKKLKVSTKDIINFWINNNHETEINDKLEDDFKPLFLYHYAAVIFYLASMLKAKELKCPRALIFSGNGSRYIDNYLTSDYDLLTELTMIIFRCKFGENVGNLQLILPDYRKESTCYGGLCKRTSIASPEEFSFMGVDDVQYKNIGELRKAFDTSLCELIDGQIRELNLCYVEMLNLLRTKGRVDYGLSNNDLKECISEGVSDALRKEFIREIPEECDDSEIYTDSLFFLPIVDKIVELAIKIEKKL